MKRLDHYELVIQEELVAFPDDRLAELEHHPVIVSFRRFIDDQILAAAAAAVKETDENP